MKHQYHVFMDCDKLTGENMIRKTIFPSLSIIFLLASCSSGKYEQGVNADDFTIRYGVYVCTHEDGSTSEIEIDKDHCTIRNADYSQFYKSYFLDVYLPLQEEAEENGYELTTDDQMRIVEEGKSVDFSVYDDMPLQYSWDKDQGDARNVIMYDTDGNVIPGLGPTYYYNDHTLGTVEGIYVLK